MNEQITYKEKYTLLSKYSLIMSVVGAASCLITFPSGIYYGFVLGITGAAGGFLFRSGQLVDIVGDLYEPIKSIDAKGNNAEDNTERNISFFHFVFLLFEFHVPAVSVFVR